MASRSSAVLDLSTGAVNYTFLTGIAGTTLIQNAPPVPNIASSVTFSVPEVSLDQHRVKVVYTGPGATGGTAMIFPALRYIY